MKLSELFKDVPDIEVESLFADSRKKRKNGIFFCVQGMMFDGHQFVDQAIDNGAVVVVHSEPIENPRDDVTYIKVKDVLDTYNKVADAFYNHPSKKLTMFGVTGTNGKSSIASIIQAVLNNYSPCGYIGTIGINYGNVQLPPVLTTPDIDDLHSILNDMVNAGMEACAMEASSIGIEQRRVDSVDFDVAIFTNLTHDHLDYHGTMQNYFLAKKKLFDDMKEDSIAIVNVDDEYGLKIVSDFKGKVITYGVENEADYKVESYRLLKDKTIINLQVGSMEFEIETNLVSKFNIYNLVAAIAALHEKGLAIETMMPHFKELPQVKGRMERVIEGQPFTVIVDYAHTPDAIEKICQFASAITPKDKRIIAVTGSAGKRDTTKRPLMGAKLDEYCDMIILTEDDPRNENVRDIAEEIAKGIEKTNYIIIEDRYDAIRQAVELADPNDFVMVIGKGDDLFMAREFGNDPWDGDIAICKEILKKYYFSEESEEA